MKQRIMEAAAKLIRQNGNRLEDITVRDIAAEAEVGVGLINYHFGTKDELFRLYAEQTVAEELSRFRTAVERLGEMEPLERLRIMSKRICDYMADHPELTRLSMLTDLRRGSYEGDNTDHLMDAFLPLVAEARGVGMKDRTAEFGTHILVHALQAGILRNASIQTRIGLDFYKKEERDRFVDLTIDQIFGEEVK